MNQIKKTSTLAAIISTVFLLASTSVFAGDDYQKQNKIIDENERRTQELNPQGSGQQSQTGSGQQSQSGSGQQSQSGSSQQPQSGSSDSGSDKKNY